MTLTMRPLVRSVAGLVLALLALGVWGAAPSSAADSATIDHAQPTKGAVRLLVTVPGTSPVDYEHVQVSLDGNKAESESVAASASSVVSRTSMLAIDTSISMRGRKIAEAKKAALTYLSTVPANVKVGVLTFDSSVKVLVQPGLDRAAARSAISGLRLTLKTALYDGVLEALKATGPGGEDAGQRRILLLSDGKDTTRTDLGGVLTAVEKSGATVDVVSLQKGGQTNPGLAQIAEASKGTVFATANPAALTAAFSREADALARQIVVTAQLPSGMKEKSANVEVTIPTADQQFTAGAYLPVRSASDIAAEKAARAQPQAVSGDPLAVSGWVMYAAVTAIGIGLLGAIAVFAFGSSRPSAARSLADQVNAYAAASAPGHPGSRQQTAAPASLSGQARQAAEKALANNSSLEERIAAALETAGLALRPAEWLLLRAGVIVAGGFLGVLLGAGNVVLGVLLFLVALVGPSIYLRIKGARRLKAFGMGLADTLQLMSGSLSAGLSLAQSIDTIVREGSEPISSEFRRVVIETRLGVTLEDSLDGVATRMRSRDFEWVVMAIRIQRDVGGNLAELLLTVAATLRERDYLRRHVRALSAEGRLSAYILGALPPGFLVYLAVSKPDYVKPMYTTPVGWILCAAMALLLSVGVFWMSKMAKVEL